MEYLIIQDAYENNLKHISLNIPLNSFTCVTGCSGCGKSSLVFDTIYAESQRAFLEGVTGNIFGQKLMNKPKVGLIQNLRPALNISQTYYNINPRSTVGTVTEISYYLRSLFAFVNSNKEEIISENIFSSNNPKYFCKSCSGLGVKTIVSESLLIPDHNKTLNDGAILFFKGPAESKEHKYLEALCDYYNIDINKKINQLTDHELKTLLYSNDSIRYKLTYKEGKRKKQHYVNLVGAITAIQKNLTDGDLASQSAYAKYMEEVTCPVCNGGKLSSAVLSYKVNGLNFAEVEGMELELLYSWFKSFNKLKISDFKRDVILQLVDTILNKINALLKLDIGYLSLNRTIPSLSGGERQRIRLASQLTCPLKGLIYILDEPCKGLHYHDIVHIIQVTKELIEKGNSVIAIEHNNRYLSASDYIIELGPKGGPEGGYIISEKSKFNMDQDKVIFKKSKKFNNYIEFKGINYRNIKNQNINLPIGGITCITGVSGSGKSSLVNAIADCLLHKTPKYCKSFSGNNFIKRIVKVNQSPIGKTPRSTIVSYLGIYDEIRSLFANTEEAKKMKLNASMFSMNITGGRCELCQGTGLQKIDLNYLPDTYITCPECMGKRFKDDILSIQYMNKNILEILETPIENIIEIFKNEKKIYLVLLNMINLGIGYLKLGQMSMNLSGGEAQRVKLAKALGTLTNGKNLYIMDEPTSGLNNNDIKKFSNILFSLQERGDTIIIVEHNINFIASIADYIIDFGLKGGALGGTISSQGEPKSVFLCEHSSLFGLCDNIDNRKI